MERDVTVDIAKGMGIILVVLGHTVAVWGGEHEMLHRFIYSFHMPLFLGVSGMYISSRSDTLTFIRSKLVRFIIPFYFWAAFYFALAFVLQVVKNLVQSNTHVMSGAPSIYDLCLVPLMASWSALRTAGIYVDLWFLPAVFSLVVICRLFLGFGLKPQFMLPVSLLLSFITVSLNNVYGFHDKLPWSIDVAITCLPFIFICRYRTYMESLHWAWIPVLVSLVFWMSREMQVEVAGLKIDDYSRFAVAATFGIMLVFLASAKLQLSWMGLHLAEIGKRAYLIFVLQGAVFMLLRPVMSRVPILISSETVFSCALFVIGLISTYSMYPLFSKYSYLRTVSLGSVRA